MASTLTRENQSLFAMPDCARLGPVLVGWEDGATQADSLAVELAGAGFDVVYTGPQRRLREAAARLADRLGLRPVVHEGLRELPAGPGALPALLRAARLAQEVRLRPRTLVLAPAGTMRVLSLLLGGWRRLPWLWRRAPASEPLVCPCDAAALSFRGPFYLLLAGLALGLLAVPGPWPGWSTFASLALAVLTYVAAAHLAARGDAGRIAALVATVSLVAVPLSFGPDVVDRRKVTTFNAWAYNLGSHLPMIFVPAPNPNAVAGLLAVALALTAAAAFYGRGWQRYVAGGATALTVGALILTASRAGWCAGAVALFVVAAGRSRRLATLVLALSGVIIAAFLGASPALGSAIDLAIRHSLWQATVDMVRAHPLTGIGLGRVAQAGVIVSGAFGQARLEATHNTLLQLWADAGILGLVAWGWALLLLGRSMLAPVRRQGVPAWATAGLCGALAAFLVQGLFETNTIFIWQTGGVMHQLFSPLPFALLGLLSGLERRAVAEAAPAAAPAPARFAAWLPRPAVAQPLAERTILLERAAGRRR